MVSFTVYYYRFTKDVKLQLTLHHVAPKHSLFISGGLITQMKRLKQKFICRALSPSKMKQMRTAIIFVEFSIIWENMLGLGVTATQSSREMSIGYFMTMM